MTRHEKERAQRLEAEAYALCLRLSVLTTECSKGPRFEEFRRVSRAFFHAANRYRRRRVKAMKAVTDWYAQRGGIRLP